MKSYLIVRATVDGLGVDQLSVVQEFDTRVEAMAFTKTLEPGTYGLLSVLRPEFVVRDSHRVVQRVVEWGQTTKPRVRKPRAGGNKPYGKQAKSAKTTNLSNGKDNTSHASA